MKNETEMKKEIRQEIETMFNEVYCGVELPTLSKATIDYFVKKALNMFETKLFYAKRLKEN